MTRRFQFSLVRLLVAMALLCAAAACFRIGAEGPLENAVAFDLLTFVLLGCGLAIIAGSRRRGFVWPFLVVHLLASSGVAFWPYGSDKMSRPHFSLKTLFWLMAVTAIICVALKQLKPAGKSRHRTGNYFATTYYWQNGIAVTLGTDEASDYPVIRIEARRSLKGGGRRAQALLKPAHPLGDRGRSISAP